MDIKYRVSGKGNPVFFLHGFLEDHSMWDTIYPVFEDLGYACFRFDLPGHGQTNIDPSNTSMYSIAHLLVEFCIKNNLKNPVVFGHSMGGYIGLEMAKLIPIKLCLVHSNFWEDSSLKKTNRNRVIEVVLKNKNRFIDEAIPNLFYSKNKLACAHIINALKSGAKKMTSENICTCTKALRDRNNNSTLLNKQSIHIIHGLNDPIIPNEKLNFELSKVDIKHDLHYIENCGHMSIWEAPAQLINCMKMIVFT